MPGLSLAFKPAERPSFAPRSHLWETASHRSRSRRHASLKEAENSELPFARPQQRHRLRAPVAGSTLPARSFVPRRGLPRTRSVQTSVPHPGWPAVGHLNSSNPLPGSNCTARTFPGPLLPVGEYTLSDRNTQPIARPKSLPERGARLPVAPQESPLGGSGHPRFNAPSSLRCARLRRFLSWTSLCSRV
jgi:hypothetical protein